MSDPITRAEEGANAAWDRAADFVRLRASLDAAEARAASAEADEEKLTAERDAAIKVQEMCAMSGGFNARWAENATKQRDAAEASASALRERVAVLESALRDCVAELGLIHGKYGDEPSADQHSVGLRRGRAALRGISNV